MGHSLLASIVVLLLSAEGASAADAPETIEATPVETIHPEIAPVDSFQIWIYPLSGGARRLVSMNLRYAEMQTTANAISIECEVQSESNLGLCHAVLEVKDVEGIGVHLGRVDFGVPKGGSACRFVWDASAVPDGAYRLNIVLYDSILRDMAWEDLDLSKYSWTATERLLDEARAVVASLDAHVDGAGEQERSASGTTRTRLAIASDYLERAETADRGNWHYASRVANHAMRMADSIRARLTFDVPERATGGEVTAPSAPIVIRDGGLYAGERPVFLAGLRGGSDAKRTLETVVRYGLDLVVFDSPLDPGAASPEALHSLWDGPLKSAQSLGVNALFVATGAEAGIDADSQRTGSKFVRESIVSLAAYLSGHPSAVGLAIASDPRFGAPADEVEQAFRDYVMGVYDDRHAMNRSWLSRYMSFDEIRIAPEYDHGAYQADWQRFQRGRLTAEMMAIRDEVAAAVPGLPLYVLYGGNVMAAGESRNGVDQQALARAFPLGGIDAVASPRHPVYGLNYPMPTIVYALRRSLAPDVPLINIEPLVPNGTFSDVPDPRGYTRTLLWDGAVEGVNGFALPAPAPGHANTLDDPAAMDGFVAAHAELNRHAGILRAFQQAPVEIGILWSEAAKVLHDGDPFLGSAMRAYEGTSFMGMKVGFVTEDRCTADTLSRLTMLVVASMPALDSKAFAEFDAYVSGGGLVIRSGTPIPYDENGQSRETVAAVSRDTLLVRGSDEPKEYLGMVDAAVARKQLPVPPRLVTRYGYPLEGVKSRHVRHEGAEYLYVVNFRRRGVQANITEGYVSGRELIGDRPVEFPMEIPPLEPMLIRLDERVPTGPLEFIEENRPAEVTEIGPDGVPTGRVRPIG